MEQLSIFDLLAESKPLPSNIKLLSLFSGIGAFEKALDNLGIGYELVGYCEIDKYASKSYSAIHGVSEDMNLWDVTKVDEKALPKDIDLITYGFPCQDISLAGKQKGLFNDDGSKTRSGLFFDALRIIEETKPRVAIAENVKNLVGKKFNAQFQVVLASLEAAGYNNYWAVLNSKDYGVPQNRERVFIVSIRKDIDKGYTFPKGFPLEKRLKDVLEDKVDEKYYLDGNFDFITKINQPKVMVEPKVIGGIGEKKSNGGRQWYQQDRIYDDGVAISVTTGFQPYYATQEPAVNVVGRINSSQDGIVVSSEGIAPTHTAGHGNTPKIVESFISIDDNSVKVREATKQGYAEAFDGDSINLEQPNSKTRRGRVGKSVAQTLTTMPQQAVVEPIVWDGYNQRIRADQTCVGTLTQNCGADLKRNGQGIIEVGTRKDIKQLEKYCEYCGAKLERKRFDGRLEDFNVFSNRKYCNRECMKRGFLKIGEGEQGWATAHHTARKINELILKKDSCEICGSTQHLDIHHIDGDWQNNNLDNLMCLCRSCHTKHERNKDKPADLRIRKLTPLETWRLMGFDDSDFHKAELVNSNTQLYKQAGNSIVVDVLEYILKQLFKEI
jgi:DNA (cytosine-5)-methyltransferase 1